MNMNSSSGWEDYLHFSLRGEHILFLSLPLNSVAKLFWTSLLTICICSFERLLTFVISKDWNPFPSVRRSRARNALWKAALHWLVTLFRLIYMLVTMSYHAGLILITVTTLAAGQFIIEYLNAPQPEYRDSYAVKEPLLGSSPQRKPSRRRAKSKPESIFIHPNRSNIARADAAVLELGLAGDTERVQSNFSEEAWEMGKGGDVARELLGTRPTAKENGDPFRVEDDADDEESS